MFIKQLKINGFRCYETVDLVFNKQINVFYGNNGSGKTSVLEAVYWLSTGKSFRSKKNKVLVNHLLSEFTLFATFQNTTDKTTHALGAGFNKSSSKKTVRHNQDTVTNQSQIAHLLPVVSIDPDSYLFIDKSPHFRRSFLDWLVFHVKPEYLPIWSKVARCQKQLNSLYKSKAVSQIDQWELQYIEYALQLNNLRFEVFEQLKTLVEKKIKQFIPELSAFSLNLYQGWTTDNSLHEQLTHDREKNLMYGNLNAGIHKMDIRNTVNKNPAHERMSRGQKKLVSIIYYLSFIELMGDVLQLNPLLCLDDMDAELDIEKTKILGDFIQHSSHQIFISTVDEKKLLGVLDDVSVFHVKHNQVNKI